MNLYHLITRSEQHFFVRARYSHDAVAHVEKLTGQLVSCWFLGDAPRATDTILNA